MKTRRTGTIAGLMLLAGIVFLSTTVLVQASMPAVDRMVRRHGLMPVTGPELSPTSSKRTPRDQSSPKTMKAPEPTTSQPSLHSQLPANGSSATQPDRQQ